MNHRENVCDRKRVCYELLQNEYLYDCIFEVTYCDLKKDKSNIMMSDEVFNDLKEFIVKNLLFMIQKHNV
jgi:hypothetical protein